MLPWQCLFVCVCMEGLHVLSALLKHNWYIKLLIFDEPILMSLDIGMLLWRHHLCQAPRQCPCFRQHRHARRTAWTRFRQYRHARRTAWTRPSCCQDSEVMLLGKISTQNTSYGHVLSLVTVLTVLWGQACRGRLLWPQKLSSDSHWQVRLFVGGRILFCF